jgi:VIT1/CCC1 family predicted Fe2+/Mn2+ transporter
MASHIHKTHRSGWLRAAVLGANDGLLSVSSLMLGVASARMDSGEILIVGLAGLCAGALSMGAGEYVSVSSQADTERADINLERVALEREYDVEKDELRDIYIRRGLDQALATQVAHQLMAYDALGAHARDEIGITDALTARPFQAAAISAISFTLGGIVPFLANIFAPIEGRISIIVIVSLASLSLLGAIAAYVGGASIFRGAVRVFIWGALAMTITSMIGRIFGVTA